MDSKNARDPILQPGLPCEVFHDGEWKSATIACATAHSTTVTLDESEATVLVPFGQKLLRYWA